MTIFLIRHGEAAAHWGSDPDPGLSEAGRIEAEGAASALGARIPGDAHIITSPLKRAQETAAPLAGRLGVEARIDETFREIPSPVPFEERRDWLRAFMAETWDDQPALLLNWRRALLDRLAELEGPVAIFTHFMVINVVIGVSLGETRTLVRRPDYVSVTEVALENGVLRLVSEGRQMETTVN